MPYEIDETHDPGLESWVESANDPGTDFPIQNLPFVCAMWCDMPRLFVAIGDKLLNVSELSGWLIKGDGLDDSLIYELPVYKKMLRKRIQQLLLRDNGVLRDNGGANLLYEWGDIDGGLEGPIVHAVRDFTDFYASVHHATNVGSMFRPDNPLLPNYKWIPVGYHGRASSVVPSGTDIIRPAGQQAPAEEGGVPGFGPCKLLDYEMELGIVMGRGNELGRPISIAEAEDHVLGMCLLNDWSARDLQKWEYQPLGPFLAKSFATTVSPYLVTMEALAPFRCAPFERPSDDPRPLDHLDSAHNSAFGGIDITVEVYIATEEMRKKGMSPHKLSSGNFKDMYWTVAQMVTHHASNGCNLQAGDLLGSGTISGPKRESRGCLLELTWDGDPWATPPVVKPGLERTAIELPSGEKRVFLQDGDEVIMKGYCEREGFRRIGFGECRGIVKPAVV